MTTSFHFSNIFIMKLTITFASIALAISLGSAVEAASCSSLYGQCGGKKRAIHDILINTSNFFCY